MAVRALMHPRPRRRIGANENGRPIDILFGALAMQQWGIRPVADNETLDLSHYPDEFVEF
jgi:hypothetical protein